MMLTMFALLAMHGDTCASLPIVAKVVSALPTALQFKCDDSHVVIIQDYSDFLIKHPDIESNALLREKGRHAFAFTINPTWPIYINLDSHESLITAVEHGRPWVVYALAGVVAHELVHAKGDRSEAHALREELEIDRQFQAEHKLPTLPLFNIGLLEQQYREAIESEASVK